MSQFALRHRNARINEIRLHWVEAGRGPPVVLLHGFPEFWYSWRLQIPALAGAGHRVVAPDQRGYNLSEKPEALEAYRIERLAGDVLGLIRRTGGDGVAVAGHDWGGAVAWHLARHHPEVVDRLVILNAPHPLAYRRAIRTSDQLLRSWYVLFFQLPWLPEMVIRAFDYRILERVLRRGPVRPGAFADEDVARYKEALRRPGALRAALNWYRANFRALASGGARGSSAGSGAAAAAGEDGRSTTPETKEAGPARSPDEKIGVPTLVIWGMRDRYLSPRLVEGLDRWVEDLRLERLREAGHWVMADAPERVNQLMTEFVGSDGG